MSYLTEDVSSGSYSSVHDGIEDSHQTIEGEELWSEHLIRCL